MIRKFELLIKSEYTDYSEQELQQYIRYAFDEMAHPYDADNVILTERTIAKNATVREVNLIEE